VTILRVQVCISWFLHEYKFALMHGMEHIQMDVCVCVCVCVCVWWGGSRQHIKWHKIKLQVPKSV
jgi:hypothetical protein